jgi:APA family basic amino acid/polyamine antiporter
LGTLIVTIIYVSTNLVSSEIIFGKIGTLLFALLIMVSTFGCNNGLILAGARVYHTMAKDGLFFLKAGSLNKFAVPSFALWLQRIFACAWSLSGKYLDLLDMISFVVVCFYMLTIGGIFILRKKRPDAHRPYKAFGYPVLPILYIIMGLAFCFLLVIFKPKFTWPGLIITLIGMPVYYLLKKRINIVQETKWY